MLASKGRLWRYAPVEMACCRAGGDRQAESPPRATPHTRREAQNIRDSNARICDGSLTHCAHTAVSASKHAGRITAHPSGGLARSQLRGSMAPEPLTLKTTTKRLAHESRMSPAFMQVNSADRRGGYPDRPYLLRVGPLGAAGQSNQGARCPKGLLAGTARDFMNIVYRAVGRVHDCMATGLDQLTGLDADPGGTVVRRLADQRAVAC